jgi:hypothetical protein
MRYAFLLAAATISAGCSLVLGPEPSSANGQLFDSLWREFDRHYSFFELKSIDWNQVRGEFRPRALTAQNDSALASVLGSMLATLQDGHVALFTPFAVYPSRTVVPPPSRMSVPLILTKYVHGSQMTRSRRMRYGRTDDGFGYLWIPGFDGNDWANEIDDALAALESARGLIIDVRNNGGGSDLNSSRIVQAFADSLRVYAYTRWRSGPRHADFTDYRPKRIGPGSGRHFSGRVVVLMNRFCFSTAEDFILQMRTIPETVFVGDSSGGGSGNPLPRELANGWTYQVSQWIMYTPDRQTFEGVGLAPDVFVRATAADSSAGVDAALERAITVLRGVR